MDENLLTRLSAAWGAEDIRPAGPASADAIAAFERRHRVSLPRDFRKYLEILNGARGGRDEMGNKETIAFWRLDEIEPLDVGGVRIFPFADFLIDSHRYAIVLSADPRASTPIVVHHNNDTLIKIAESFTDFVRGYLSADEDVLHPTPTVSGPSA